MEELVKAGKEIKEVILSQERDNWLWKSTYFVYIVFLLKTILNLLLIDENF